MQTTITIEVTDKMILDAVAAVKKHIDAGYSITEAKNAAHNSIRNVLDNDYTTQRNALMTTFDKVFIDLATALHEAKNADKVAIPAKPAVK